MEKEKEGEQSREGDEMAATTFEIPVPAEVTVAAPPSKLQLTGVSRNYQNGKTAFVALHNINLEVRACEFLCLVGPSGCGKSTLLHMIAGLDKPSSGKVLHDGTAITGPGADRIIIFQELGLFPWLKVRDNVEFGLKVKGVPKQERRERARHFLRLVHLSQFEENYVHQLSGGMKQRVALARALAV